MKSHAIIACGHPATAQAAEQILEAGGNAFDAIVAAHYAACVSEPILASLGGGGFMLAHTHDGQDLIYDFFTQTPAQRQAPDDCDFYPIHADFGTTRQEFHIGMGAVAVPGAVKGMFAIQRELCTLPMHELIIPARELARTGIALNAFQAYILDIIKPILLSTPEAKALYANPQLVESVKVESDLLSFPQMANVLDALASEGDDLFYQGELAVEIDRLSRDYGGHIRLKDLQDYHVVKRDPLSIHYREVKVVTNPPPSSGGILIGFALKLLSGVELANIPRDSIETLAILRDVMCCTNKARLDTHIDESDTEAMLHILDEDYLRRYKTEIYQRNQCQRGTTHISIIDRHGNLASMTVSNGEGCGHVIPDTSIMLNNMLGEEDLNPHGFHQWPISHRMTSMMAPSAVFYPDGKQIALGSGGSNRLRTALLQVLINLIDYDMPIEAAINFPRIHQENDMLNLESGLPQSTINTLLQSHPGSKVWDAINLYFGGTHCVMQHGNHVTGAGDPRRGGVCRVVQ